MAKPVYKRGNIYWCNVFDPEVGKNVRRSTRCRDEKAAIAWRREFERRAADPAYFAAYEATIAEAILKFLEDRRRRGRAQATLDSYDQKARHIARVLGERTRLVYIEASSVDRYIGAREEENAHAHTIHKELVVLRGILKVAKRTKAYPHDIAAVMPVGFSPRYVPRTRHLTWDELYRLLDQLPRSRAAQVALVVALGPRLSEAKKLRRSDIDLKKRCVTIRGTKTEGAARTIPVPDIFLPLLDRALRDAPGKDVLVDKWSNARRGILRACKRAKIEPVTWNDLRRTFGSLLRQADVYNADIAKLMGHADTKMVDRVYGQTTPESLAASLRHALRKRTNRAQAPRRPSFFSRKSRKVRALLIRRSRVRVPAGPLT
jgi:integrase